VWRAALALGVEELCVVEDDMEFVDPTRFADQWRKFREEIPTDWLMVHVGAVDRRPIPVSERCVRVVQQYGTWFMLLRRDALIILSAAADRAAASEPADWLLLDLFATGRVYRPTELLVRVRDEVGIQLEVDSAIS
jgi:hypothetical protein